MADSTATWREMFEQSRKRLAEELKGESIFLAEMQRELDHEREAWTPRKRRAQALRRSYYRARWWLEENVAWRLAREHPYR